jgi:hypothetical protein
LNPAMLEQQLQHQQQMQIQQQQQQHQVQYETKQHVPPSKGIVALAGFSGFCLFTHRIA